MNLICLLFSLSLMCAVSDALALSVHEPSSYATDTSVWKKIRTTNQPTARHENAFVELNGKFYLMGGRGIKPVDIYDPQDSTWTVGATPPLEMHHFQAVTYQDKIYVMGAFTGGYPDEQPIPHVYTYDPAQDVWTKGAEIPVQRRRGAAGVVVHDDQFYLVNGIRNGHSSGHTQWLDAYDPKNEAWTVLPDAPHTRDHFQAAVINGKLYAAGGRNSSAATGQTFELTIPEVDVYDIEAQTWTTLAEPLPTERAGSTTVVYDDYLIVIGGESEAMEAGHHQAEVWDTQRRQWAAWPRLQQGRHGTQAVVYDNAVYIAAGSGNRGGGPELNDIETYRLAR